MTTVVLWGGLDPGGQAGLAADLQVVHALQANARLVLTARTAQADRQFQQLWPVQIRELQQVLSTLELPAGEMAIKSGMLATRAHARALVQFARSHPQAPLVVDPLLHATSGGLLWKTQNPQTIAQFLLNEVLPHARVVTANWPELEALAGQKLADQQTAEQAMRNLPCAVVLKGGHAPLELLGVDLLWDGQTLTTLQPLEIWQKSPRGTGCRFATALAIQLARGQTLLQAMRAAKSLVSELIYGV